MSSTIEVTTQGERPEPQPRGAIVGPGVSEKTPDNKFFIVGCGRSGTTMLQQALNRHSRVVIPPETGFFLDLVGHTLRGQRNHMRQIAADLKIDAPPIDRRASSQTQIRELFEEIAARYIASLRKTGAIKNQLTHFGEKSPRHLLCLPRILAAYPNASIILIYRDGRDVAPSLARVPWGPSDLYVNFGIWLRFVRAQLHARELTGMNLCEVKYESLVADPKLELERICTFLGLPCEDALAEGSGNREGVPEWEDGWKARALQPINQSRAQLWRTQLTETQLARMEAWGRRELELLGYELSQDPPRLPLWFLPRVWIKQNAWRIGRALKVAKKETMSDDGQRRPE